jgi:mono/diheme cytochrome c family protein
MRVFQHRAAVLSVCLPIVAAISACNQPPVQAPAAPAAPAQTPAQRGAVLVQAGGCHDCHSPKTNGAVDKSVMLSGHPSSIKITAPDKVSGPWVIGTTDMLTAWSGPWGISFAANITPDPDTGLKSSAWSEEAFIKAMRTGKHIGTGRDILLPMPWFMYKDLNDEDLKAIWAYLMTVPPVKNEVPDPIPPAGAKK